jgi:general secretion pathway protein M
MSPEPVSMPSMPGGASAWRAQAVERWRALGARERGALGLAVGVLGLALLWLVALQPAWRVVSQAPQRIAALDAQLQAMHTLAAEARAWREVAALPEGQAAPALQAATARLGARGRLLLQGERAVLTLEGATPAELQAWLAEARAGARARPVEAQLTRGEAGLSGTVVVALGAGS